MVVVSRTRVKIINCKEYSAALYDVIDTDSAWKQAKSLWFFYDDNVKRTKQGTTTKTSGQHGAER